MKLYRTRTQAEYDWLAKELGKKGMTSYIPRHEQGGDIVVYADEKEDFLSYSDLNYAQESHPNEPIIEVSDLMDNKFNVGDEVRVVKEAPGTSYVDSVGDILEIEAIWKKDTMPYQLTNGYWYSEDCLEPITDHDYLMDKILERNNKPEKLNTGDPWIDNLPESYFEMYEEESKTDKYARHKEITDYMHKTYVSKNKDYGNSFERTHKEIGSRASLGRIADKFYRLQNIILNDEQLVEDETVKDTLIDMANYAIMFAMELEEEE